MVGLTYDSTFLFLYYRRNTATRTLGPMSNKTTTGATDGLYTL